MILKLTVTPIPPASCSCKKFSKPSASHRSPKLEAESIYETRSRDVYPNVRYDQYRRGLCILDPYGLHLDWNLIQQAGNSRSIEIFLNFPVMDMNMNVLWHDPEKVPPTQRKRMSRFWGDESWKTAAYSGSGNLFGFPEKGSNEDVAAAFQKRLANIAGFKVVPDPIPMRNTIGATVYYFFFAAHQSVASDIVTSIFNKYRNRGATNG